MFTSRKSAASTLVSLIIATLAILGIASGTASADTHWKSVPVTTQGPTDCPADTHWNAELQICVEDTHW
ncbi:hypothetical protein G7043_43605 [Lentzea sp. NEAU-D13]|uniref:Chitin binding Peritrophin-A domain-containing protein n=1 Tax=Lentzea alba TaxID=2714351 RepID=A0A7C9W4L7_9PSEU|nr:hypothetical protein [Lentzea alba]NGY58491.1 hypothetical protein [Lentzea alba]NGY65798.1 hypothetical protein [Lentzea alba]